MKGAIYAWQSNMIPFPLFLKEECIKYWAEQCWSKHYTRLGLKKLCGDEAICCPCHWGWTKKSFLHMKFPISHFPNSYLQSTWLSSMVGAWETIYFAQITWNTLYNEKSYFGSDVVVYSRSKSTTNLDNILSSSRESAKFCLFFPPFFANALLILTNEINVMRQ